MGTIAYRVVNGKVYADIYQGEGVSLGGNYTTAGEGLQYAIQWLNAETGLPIHNYTFNYLDISKVEPGNYEAYVYEAASGNSTPPPYPWLVTIDTIAPNVIATTTSSNNDRGTGNDAIIKLQFSEQITGFDINDLNVSHGKLSLLSSSFSSFSKPEYTVIYTPDSNYEGSDHLTIRSGAFYDKVGNTNNTYDYLLSGKNDTINPSLHAVTFTFDEINQKIIFDFTEQPINFNERDIIIDGASIIDSPEVNSIDPTLYSFKYVPSSNYQGKISVEIPAGSYQDSAGNYNGYEKWLGPVIDTKPPTVNVTNDIGVNPYLSAGESANFIFTFSEPVKDIKISINSSIGSFSEVIADLQHPNVYESVFTPNPNIEAPLNFSVTFKDFADLNGIYVYGAQPSGFIDVSVNSPIITFSSENVKSGQSSIVTFDFDEAVNNFDYSDISLSKGGRFHR